MNLCDIGSANIAYRIYGCGNKALVIDTCLCSCSAEWCKQYRAYYSSRQ